MHTLICTPCSSINTAKSTLNDARNDLYEIKINLFSNNVEDQKVEC